MIVYAGLAGLAVAALGWILEPLQFYAGWLAAVTLFAAWPLGSMAILLIHALTGGRWGDALQPALRLGVSTLPLLLPAVVPLAFGTAALYPWAHTHVENGFYLNMPFFAVRGAIYFMVWLALGAFVLRARRLSAIAPVGLFLLAVTTTFAAIDTTMSLDPHFTSSIYGLINGAGMVLLALSVALLLTAGELPPGVWADFGKLLLAVVILWIYLDFMQLLIVWQSDLASEAPWFLARSRGFWGALRSVIAVGHVLLPFCLLLSPTMQRSRRAVMFVAGLLIVMEVLRCWWTVLPSLGLTPGWIDLACIVGLGSVAIGFARWMARRATNRALSHA